MAARRATEHRGGASTLALLGALVGCSASRAPTASAPRALPPRTTAPVAVTAGDDPLAVVPPSAVVAFTADVPRVRALPVVSMLLEGFLASRGVAPLRAAIASACGFEPLARIASIRGGMAAPGDGVSVVLRGRFDPADAPACFSAVTGADGPGGPVVRVAEHDGHALYGPDARDATQAVLATTPGGLVLATPSLLPATLAAIDAHGPSAARDADLRAVRDALGSDPAAMVLATRVGLEPLFVRPGDVTAPLMALHTLAAGASVEANAAGTGLELLAAARFASDDDARQGAALLTAAWQQTLRQLLTADAGAALARVVFEAHGSMVRAALALSAAELARVLRDVLDGVTAAPARTARSEAVEHLEYLARAEQAYAAEPAQGRAQRARFTASAPRTPAHVPRGTTVVDPPGTWDHATWHALDFEITDAHAFSYEVASDGRSFTARALGDLDGDGRLSTFERAGRIATDGGVELAPLVSHDEDE